MGDVTADQPLVPRAWPPNLVQFYETHFVEFVRLAYLVTGSQAIAEELAQDTFLAVQDEWDRIEKLHAYIRVALINRCSWFRRADVEERHRSPAPEPGRIEADELWDVLDKLAARRRAAIVLRFYEDLPDAEIAEILDCAQPTVRTLIHRGLEQLRKELEP